MQWGQTPPIPVWVVLLLAITLAIISGALLRTTRSAFLAGMAVFYAGIWYSMWYQGLFEMAGVVHAAFLYILVRSPLMVCPR